ncbi:MAG: hypothetical protein WC554_09750 [Clostridia bacterium]
MRAIVTLTVSGRINPIFSGYRPLFRIDSFQSDCYITNFVKINPDESSNVNIEVLLPDKFKNLKNGDIFILAEGRKKVADGIIIEI